MASRFQPSHPSFLLFLLLLFSSSLSHSLVSSKKPPAAARKGDIPFIKCQVCEKISHQIIHQAKKKEAQISPKKVSELQIIEIAENICNLKKDESDWILQIDLVEKGDKLELVEQRVEGLCNSECKTIERACQELFDYLFAKGAAGRGYPRGIEDWFSRFDLPHNSFDSIRNPFLIPVFF